MWRLIPKGQRRQLHARQVVCRWPPRGQPLRRVGLEGGRHVGLLDCTGGCHATVRRVAILPGRFVPVPMIGRGCGKGVQRLRGADRSRRGRARPVITSLRLEGIQRRQLVGDGRGRQGRLRALISPSSSRFDAGQRQEVITLIGED